MSEMMAEDQRKYDELCARVESVLALHVDLMGSCQECQWAEFPCETRRLLAPIVSTTS